MINVQDVINSVPHFATFCSVEKLNSLAERLREDVRFHVRVAGTSANDVPIYHVRCGTGAVKALIVAGPHAPEPIGSLTVFSLMTLLQQGNRALYEADVEWHIVPCIDPDATVLNEGWTQKPFSLETYVRNFHVQAPLDQVDMSFPIKHKRLVVDRPSKEARVLQGLLDSIRPEFFFSLHNAWMGEAFFFLTRDIGEKYQRQIRGLLEEHRLQVQKKPTWSSFMSSFGDGMFEMSAVKKYYDYLEKIGVANPEESLKNYGAGSQTYLEEVNPEGLVFVAELGYVRHPDETSQRTTGKDLRKFMLRLEADRKFLIAAILEEWENVKGDVDPGSPFYKALIDGLDSAKAKLHEGGLVGWSLRVGTLPTRDILFNPDYGRTMTEADRLYACLGDDVFVYPHNYQFVRLLKSSRQTPAIKRAIERLEQVFDDGLRELGAHVDLGALEVIDCNTLAKVQLGSGLIALNSVLERGASRASDGTQSAVASR